MSIWQKVGRYRRAHGTRATMHAVARKLSAGGVKAAPRSVGRLSQKADVIGHFESILGRKHGSADELARTNPGPKTLQWVIPSFGFGSGGHLNIFRFINNLSKLGYDQRVVILPPHDWKSARQAKEVIAQWYFPLSADLALGVEGFAPAHATIATGWQTAYWAAKYQATRERFYFVQDFEPAFYATSSEYYLAEETYRLGLKGITAGTWLSELLGKDYGMKTGAVSFAVDTDFYQPGDRQQGDTFNVLFYSRHATPRRLFELGLCALDLLCQKHPDVSVVFAGGDVSSFRIPFRHQNKGELSLIQLPELYRNCDLALVLSGTNLSLLPLELAACKCPVVLNDSPSARWLLPESEAFYAPLDPEGMAQSLSHAVTDKVARDARTKAAYQRAIESSWMNEARQVAHYLETL